MNQPNPNPPLDPPRLTSVRITNPKFLPTSIVVDKDGLLIDRITEQPVRLDLPKGTLVNVMTHNDTYRIVERLHMRLRASSNEPQDVL